VAIQLRLIYAVAPEHAALWNTPTALAAGKIEGHMRGHPGGHSTAALLGSAILTGGLLAFTAVPATAHAAPELHRLRDRMRLRQHPGGRRRRGKR